MLSVLIVGGATVAWMAGLYALDRNWRHKQSGHVVVLMIVAGGLSIVPTLWLYDLNPLWIAGRAGYFAYHFAYVGLTEELTKFAVFVVMSRIMKSIREPQDGIVQGAAVGVGFSAVEDVLYGFTYGPATALMRSMIVGIHAIAGALVGYFWAGAVYENTNHDNPQVYRSALVSVILVAIAHSLYNSIWYWIPDSRVDMFANGIFMLSLSVVVFVAYRSMARRSAYYRFPYSESATAIAYIRAGIAHHPESALLYRRLGIYALADGRTSLAVESLGKALKMTPPASRRLIRFFYGVALLASGEDETGSRHLQRSLSGLSSSRRRALNRELREILPAGAFREDVMLRVVPLEDRLTGGFALRENP